VARIVLSTFGSLGDLHPFLAIARELRNRGHEAVIASSAVYRNKVEGENIEFASVRPDVGELLEQPAMLRKIWGSGHGTEYLQRDYLAQRIEQSYEDLTFAPAARAASIQRSRERIARPPLARRWARDSGGQDRGAASTHSKQRDMEPGETIKSINGFLPPIKGNGGSNLDARETS
jgi:hypothetical protein